MAALVIYYIRRTHRGGGCNAGTQLRFPGAGRQKAIHDCPHLLEFGILRHSTE